MITYQTLGSPQNKPLILLHGLYGYGRNWLGLARQLATDYWVILPDLRNHGASFHDETWNYTVMAEDLAKLVQSLRLHSLALLGHSMGGKVAMAYALQYGANTLSHLIVADMGLKAYAATYHQQLLEALSALDLSQLVSRQQANEALAEAIPETAVRQFLLSNLKRNDSGWYWQFNLPVLQRNLTQITAALVLDGTNKGLQFNRPALFLGGSRSDYLLPEDLPAIQVHFPQARAQWISGAGHWLHTEQPQAVEQALRQFLTD